MTATNNTFNWNSKTAKNARNMLEKAWTAKHEMAAATSRKRKNLETISKIVESDGVVLAHYARTGEMPSDCHRELDVVRKEYAEYSAMQKHQELVVELLKSDVQKRLDPIEALYTEDVRRAAEKYVNHIGKDDTVCVEALKEYHEAIRASFEKFGFEGITVDAIGTMFDCAIDIREAKGKSFEKSEELFKLDNSRRSARKFAILLIGIMKRKGILTSQKFAFDADYYEKKAREEEAKLAK